MIIRGFKYAGCTCNITCFKLCDNTKVQSTFYTYGFFVQDALHMHENEWDVRHSQPILYSFSKKNQLSINDRFLLEYE